MDDVRIGRILRGLRLRKRWRQRDVAVAAGISQSTVSLIERGHVASLSLRTLRRVFGAVDARLTGEVSWRGGLTDRLLARGRRMVTFAVYGERGSIDIVALRPTTGHGARRCLAGSLAGPGSRRAGLVTPPGGWSERASLLLIHEPGWFETTSRLTRPTDLGRLVSIQQYEW